MSLRVNHSLAAENASRNFFKEDFSPGKRVLQLMDKTKSLDSNNGAASLAISKKMRAKVVGLSQFDSNLGPTLSSSQAVEKSFGKISSHLENLRQLACHTIANTNSDRATLDANQAEISNILDQIDQIAEITSCDSKALFKEKDITKNEPSKKGSFVVLTNENTRNHSARGYKVRVRQFATKSAVRGTIPLSAELICQNEELKIAEGWRQITVLSQQGESVADFVRRTQKELEQKGFRLKITIDHLNQLFVQHHDFGSEHFFTVSSSTGGVLSKIGNTKLLVQNGQDVAGSIDGEYAVGSGEFLTGVVGSSAEGLMVKVSSDLKHNQKIEMEFNGVSLRLRDSTRSIIPNVRTVPVEITVDSLALHADDNDGEQTSKPPLPNMAGFHWGHVIANSGNFINLRALDIRTMQGAYEAIKLIDTSIDEISEVQSQTWKTEKCTLDSNIASLSVAKENVAHTSSSVDDFTLAARTIKNTITKTPDQLGYISTQEGQNSHCVLTLLD